MNQKSPLFHAIELQALAQSGLAYEPNEFDRERYERIMEIAAELVASQSYHSYQEVLERFRTPKGYATPQVDVRGALIEEGKILLVREKSDGRWSLPGGWADVGLSAAQNIHKEMKEEAGLETRAVRLIAVYDKNKSNITCRWPAIYKIFFLCEREKGDPSPLCNEIIESGFFRSDALPELSLDRVTPTQIALCFRYAQNPDLPAFFDE